MPVIKGYTAGGGNNMGVPRTPALPEADQSSLLGLTSAAKDISQAANLTARVATAMKAQRNELDYLDMKTQYDARIDAIKQDLAHDMYVVNQPETYETQFTNRVKEMQTDLLTNSKNPDASKLFVQYFGQQYPKDLVLARGAGLKLQADKAVSQIDELGSKIAASSTGLSPDKLSSSIGDYTELVNRAYNRGFIGADDRVKKIEGFQQKMTSNYAMVLAGTSGSTREMFRSLDRGGAFDNLPERTRMDIHTFANLKDSQEASRTKQVLDQAKEDMFNHMAGLALYGSAPQEVLDDIQQNKMSSGPARLLTPMQGHQLQQLNDSAPAGGTNRAARWIVSSMLADGLPLTPERLNSARNQLRDVLLDAGVASTDMESSLKYLNSEFDRLRTTNAAELNAGKTYAKDIYDATVRQYSPIPMIQHRLQNDKVIDLAEFNKRFFESPDKSPEAAAKLMKEIMDRRKVRIDGRSEDQKTIDELVK